MTGAVAPTVIPSQLALTTFAGNANAPLTPAQIDANWSAIVAFCNQFLSTLVPQFTAVQSQDGQSLSIMNGSTVFTTVSLPASPITPGGAYTPGVTYAKGVMLLGLRSSYLTSRAFTATTLAADILNGNLTLLAQAGGPGYTPQGQYNPNTAYNLGDAVSLTGNGDLWVMTLPNIPAGTSPPSAPWGLSAANMPLATSRVFDATSNATMDKIIASFLTLIQALQTTTTALKIQSDKSVANIASINSQLGVAGVTGFPLSSTSHPALQ
jgi:hypothetical protein